jgi:hypothetical protein
VQHRVQGRGREARALRDVAEERVRQPAVAVPRVLEQVMQLVGARGRAEHPADRREPLDGERRPVGQPHVVAGEVPRDFPGGPGVAGVAVVVGGVPRGDGGVGEPVDILGAGAEAGQPAGDQRVADAVRRERQVGDGAEAAERLPEHRPLLLRPAQLAPDQLAVEDDGVRAEVREVLRLRPRRPEPGEGPGGGRRRAAGAALVEQEHPVVVQGPVEPRGAPDGPLGGESRPALQEHQPRQPVVAGLADGGDLPGEHGDPVAAGPPVVQWDAEVMVGEDSTRLPVGAHEQDYPGRPAARSRGHAPSATLAGALAGGQLRAFAWQRAARAAARPSAPFPRDSGLMDNSKKRPRGPAGASCRSVAA